MRLSARYLLALGGVLAFAAGPTAYASGHATAHKQVAVTIHNYAFGPKRITVKRGQTVVWTNRDVAVHTVTASASSRLHFHSKDLGKGATFRVTFTRTGTFTYHCIYHAFMRGTIKVTAR